MNCPGCGLQTLAEQKFCRSCGTSLQLTTQPLAGAASGSKNTPTVNVKAQKQRPNAFMLWGFIMMFIGIAIGVIGKKLMHEDIVTVVGVLLSLLGMFLTVYPFLLTVPSKRNDSSSPSEPKVLASSPPKSLPEDRQVEYIPSVTERTTDLLESGATTTHSRKEDESREQNDY